jgi:N-ethylmaleimide reductase
VAPEDLSSTSRASKYGSCRNSQAGERCLENLASFGHAYLANPDLALRLKISASLNPPDSSTFYGGDEKGYVDYPELAVR